MSNSETHAAAPVMDHAARIAGTTLPSAVSHDEVARRAHAIYLKSGSVDGQCDDHWEQAEKQLKEEALAMCAADACCGPVAAGLAGVIGQLAPLPVSTPAVDVLKTPAAASPRSVAPKAAGIKG